MRAVYDYEDVKSFSKPIDIPPFWIEMAGISNCDETYRIFREHSKVCVCEYIIKGSGTLQIGEKTYHPKAGDIYILPEFERHEYYTNPKDPWTKIFFNVRGTGVSAMLNAFEMKNKILFSDCKELYPVFQKIFEKTKEDIDTEQIMIECCQLFVQLLFSLYNKAKTIDATLEEAKKVKTFIENNIERELSMKEIADSIYRSKDYTNKLFKRYYNVTPYSYYVDLRIEKAKALLQHTTLTISQISEKLGYKNGKGFSKQFHYVTGMTASRYRQIEHGVKRDDL
ncbi:MAG: helix-turn-helix domain-containing protein [Tyzzerella sp.]|nr:helix-turn-helix domain-containing protein [Tyzzerella sp.]